MMVMLRLFTELPAPRLVRVVSLLGSILCRAHCGNAARSDRLGDCRYDRNSRVEEAAELGVVGCWDRC